MLFNEEEVLITDEFRISLKLGTIPHNYANM